MNNSSETSDVVESKYFIMKNQVAAYFRENIKPLLEKRFPQYEKFLDSYYQRKSEYIENGNCNRACENAFLVSLDEYEVSTPDVEASLWFLVCYAKRI